MSKERYSFSWQLIGDIGARKNLGPMTRVDVYRLMQFTIRDVLERRFDSEVADTIFRESGLVAGREFYKQFLSDQKELHAFTAKLQSLLRELGIGILRIEKVDMEQGRLILTVDEDLDCSGLPELDHEFCAYDEGFISGILGSFLGREVDVKEIDCWCTGARTCRFEAIVRDKSDS